MRHIQRFQHPRLHCRVHLKGAYKLRPPGSRRLPTFSEVQYRIPHRSNPGKPRSVAKCSFSCRIPSLQRTCSKALGSASFSPRSCLKKTRISQRLGRQYVMKSDAIYCTNIVSELLIGGTVPQSPDFYNAFPSAVLPTGRIGEGVFLLMVSLSLAK